MNSAGPPLNIQEILSRPSRPPLPAQTTAQTRKHPQTKKHQAPPQNGRMEQCYLQTALHTKARQPGFEALRLTAGKAGRPAPLPFRVRPRPLFGPAPSLHSPQAVVAWPALKAAPTDASRPINLVAGSPERHLSALFMDPRRPVRPSLD